MVCADVKNTRSRLSCSTHECNLLDTHQIAKSGVAQSGIQPSTTAQATHVSYHVLQPRARLPEVLSLTLLIEVSATMWLPHQ
jgi:hypothetical protein